VKIHRYKNYKDYVKQQVKKNAKQLHITWATPEEMEELSIYIKRHLPHASFGICHGAKHGWEARELQRRLDIKVIGTDIADTALRFDNMIKWDFHEVKPEWIGAVDFIYSNALDHSYDPTRALSQWLKCLKPTGLCFVEWSELHGEAHSTADDPFGASFEEYQELILRNYSINDILEIPRNPNHRYPYARKIFVVALRDSS
jgi:hypothetical protein